jgi:hypothetical protein
MPPLRTKDARRPPAARARITNHADRLSGTDQRSAIARRYFDICAQIIADQGGADRCAEVRLQLIRRLAASAVLAERMESRLARGEAIDITEHALLTSSMVRVATRIGLGRTARAVAPTLEAYLASKADKEDTDAAASE